MQSLTSILDAMRRSKFPEPVGSEAQDKPKEDKEGIGLEWVGDQGGGRRDKRREKRERRRKEKQRECG